MKKRIIIICLTVILSTVCTVGMMACVNKIDTFTTDYFVCMYNGDKTEVTILELTDLGKEQEVLVIPGAINGRMVSILGGTLSGLIYQKNYDVISENLKKVYVYDNTATASCCRGLLQINPIVEVVILSFNLIDRNPTILWYADDDRNIYLSRYLYETDYFRSMELEHNLNHIKVANIEFYINKNDKEPYFVDNYNEEELYILPEKPKKSGYKFLGWVDEKDNLRDGTYPQSQEEQLNLYAKWTKV